MGVHKRTLSKAAVGGIDAKGVEDLPPTGITDPSGVHLAHVAHADDAHHCVSHHEWWHRRLERCC